MINRGKFSQTPKNPSRKDQMNNSNSPCHDPIVKRNNIHKIQNNQNVSFVLTSNNSNKPKIHVRSIGKRIYMIYIKLVR